MDMLPIRRAILSVTDKTGLVEFATFLSQNGVELVSTGGTMKALQAAGLPVTAVSDVTGFPEILGGRVKTLHPKIHGGILANKDIPEHMATLEEKEIKPFDLVCVNLYDFAGAQALARTGRGGNRHRRSLHDPRRCQELPQHPGAARNQMVRHRHAGDEGTRHEGQPGLPSGHGLACV